MLALHHTLPPLRIVEPQEIVVSQQNIPSALLGYRMPQLAGARRAPVRGGSLVVGNVRQETILVDLRLILDRPEVPAQFSRPLTEYRLFSILNDKEQELIVSDKFWRILNRDPQWLEFAGVLLGGHALAYGVKDFLLKDPFLDPRVYTAWLRALFSYENYRCTKAACSRDGEESARSSYFCLPFRSKQEKQNRKKMDVQSLINKFLWSHQATAHRARLPFELELSAGTCVDNYRYTVIDREFVQQSADIEATLADVKRSVDVIEALAEQTDRAEVKLQAIIDSYGSVPERIEASRFAEVEEQLLKEEIHKSHGIQRKPEFIRTVESVLPLYLAYQRKDLSLPTVLAYISAARSSLNELLSEVHTFRDKNLESLDLPELENLFNLHSRIIDLIKLHFVRDILPERLEHELNEGFSVGGIEQRRAELRGPLVGHYLTDTQLSLLTKVGLDVDVALALQKKTVWHQSDRDQLAAALIQVAPYWHQEMREYLAGMLMNSYGPFFYDDWPVLPPKSV